MRSDYLFWDGPDDYAWSDERDLPARPVEMPAAPFDPKARLIGNGAGLAAGRSKDGRYLICRYGKGGMPRTECREDRVLQLLDLERRWPAVEIAPGVVGRLVSAWVRIEYLGIPVGEMLLRDLCDAWSVRAR